MNNTNNTPHTVGHVGWSPDYKSAAMPPVTGKLISCLSEVDTAPEQWRSQCLVARIQRDVALSSLAELQATTGSPRKLATKIAARLFTNGFGNEGTRLEIKSGIDGRHSERSLGGWCFQAAVDQIEKVIIEKSARPLAPADTQTPDANGNV